MLYGYVHTKPKSEIVTMKMEKGERSEEKVLFFFFGENNFISSRDM